MLRIVIILICLLPGLGYSEVEKYKEPDKASIAKQKGLIDDAMKEARNKIQDGEVSELLNRERSVMSSMPQAMPGLDIQMPNLLDARLDDGYLAKALAAGNSISEANAASMEAKYPIILISLSMPESQIKALIIEADMVGAAIAVRGLVDDDVQKTFVRFRQIAGDSAGGVMIDPAVFQRFDAKEVPTFILPLEVIQQCTNEGCPTPKHVKAVGSATLQYFLDLVARTGDSNEKIEANIWLAKYED